MSQDFQSIGQASTELDAVAAEHQGWQQDTPQPEVEELTDGSDFSFWDRRANSQVMYRDVPNMAAHTETPVAAVDPKGCPSSVTPFDPLQGGNA